jgi:hypothetical protein
MVEVLGVELVDHWDNWSVIMMGQYLADQTAYWRVVSMVELMAALMAAPMVV